VLGGFLNIGEFKICRLHPLKIWMTESACLLLFQN
jgi:hypothetical protein